jgi:hypothetical protein
MTNKNDGESFKVELWNKIRKSRGLSGEVYHYCQDVYSECFDEMQNKIDALEADLEILGNELSRKTVSNNEMFQQLKEANEVVNYINEIAPAMYEYNEVEMKMVLKAREYKAKYKL